MSTPTNVTIDNQLEYTYKEITLDTSANIVDYRIKIWGRELYYSEGDIDLNVSFVDKSRGSVTIQPLRRITFAEGKGFNEIIINSSTTTATSCKLIITSGDLIVQDYTAEVSGTSSVNITKIGGEDVTPPPPSTHTHTGRCFFYWTFFRPKSRSQTDSLRAQGPGGCFPWSPIIVVIEMVLVVIELIEGKTCLEAFGGM